MSGLFADRVFAMLLAAAEAGAACPTNQEIADTLGIMANSRAGAVIAQLERRRLIAVERRSHMRRVTIMRVGARTAWSRPAMAITNAIDTEGYRGPVPEHLRVMRDSCGWCGVRADIGCRHRRRAGFPMEKIA
jgi:hypothetical protein